MWDLVDTKSGLARHTQHPHWEFSRNRDGDHRFVLRNTFTGESFPLKGTGGLYTAMDQALAIVAHRERGDDPAEAFRRATGEAQQ